MALEIQLSVLCCLQLMLGGAACTGASDPALGTISIPTDTFGQIVFTDLGINTGTLACGGDCSFEFIFPFCSPGCTTMF